MSYYENTRKPKTKNKKCSYGKDCNYKDPLWCCEDDDGCCKGCYPNGCKECYFCSRKGE